METLSSYAVSHGQAVAIGTCVMARICAKKACAPRAVADEIAALFRLHGLPTETSLHRQRDRETPRGMDKKRQSDRITLVWIEDFGRCVLKDIAMDDYEPLLRLGLR